MKTGVRAYYSIHRIGAKPKWKPCHSFLKNFAILVKMAMGHSSAATDSHYETGAKDTDGVERSIYDCAATYRFSGTFIRISIGDKLNPVAPTPDDYCYNQLYYDETVTFEPASHYGVNVEGSKSSFVISATFILGEDILVSEIGYTGFYRISESVATQFLLLRDVVSPPVLFPSGVAMMVTYKIEVEA
jgi:hypothetical protein